MEAVKRLTLVCWLNWQTFHYLGVYNQIVEYELPRLHAHFQDTGIEAQMYAVDWYGVCLSLS